MDESVPRVTVAVIERETFAHTKRSLESLYVSTTLPFKLVYVDAGSPRSVFSYLRKEARRRSFQLVRYDRFLWENEAKNAAMPFVDTEFVVFVDNDVLFAPGWLEALVACADEEQAGVVGPVTCLGDPPFTVVHAAGGRAWFEETAAGRSFITEERGWDMPLAELRGDLTRSPVDSVEFHVALVRSELVRALGPFDEALKTMWEDKDFCLLAGRAGYTVWIEPAALVSHLLPHALPRGALDLRFLLHRWNRRDNIATVAHFGRKWGLRADDAHGAWISRRATIRPLELLAGKKLIKALRAIKRRVGGMTQVIVRMFASCCERYDLRTKMATDRCEARDRRTAPTVAGRTV